MKPLRNAFTTAESSSRSHRQLHCRLWLCLISACIAVGMRAQSTDSIPQTGIAEVPQLLSGRHFTWGADMGPSVDLTGHNLTTVDLNINFGYTSPAIQILGVSMGLHRAFGSGNTFVPVCAILRTSFRSRPSRFFFNLKAGYSFNTIQEENFKGGFQLSTGLGIILQRTKKIQSHIIIGYGFYHINRNQAQNLPFDANHVDYAQLAIGVSF